MGVLPVCGQATREFDSPDGALAYLQTLSNRFEAANAEYRGESKLPENYESLSEEEQTRISQEISLWAKGVWDRMEDSVIQADQIVPQMVAQMLATGSLDDVMIRYPSNDTLQWIEGTSALSSEEFEQIRLDAMSSKAFFSVVHQDIDLKDGRVLYVFGQYRLTGVPREQKELFDVAHASSFVIRKTPEEVVLHRINMEDDLSVHPYGTFAGFIRDNEGGWPSLVFIRGPEGSGQYLRVFQSEIDEEADMLHFRRYDEYYAPVSTYAFDPQSGSVTLDYSHKYGAGGGEHTVDSSELVGEGYPLQSSEGVHFAVGTGARVDTAMATPGSDDADQRAETSDPSSMVENSAPESNEDAAPDVPTQGAGQEAAGEVVLQPGEERSSMLTYGIVVAIIIAAVAILILVRNRRKS
ncbi:MAG: hypothetical protein AMXMBFR82_48070 [Candidatus Hydrogenedentota bacterium]